MDNKNFESRKRILDLQEKILDLQEKILESQSNLLNFAKKDHGPMSVFTSIGDFFKRIFHKCNFKTIEVPNSNKKGEIWIQECQCGQKRKVLFDAKGKCRSINKI